MSLRSALYAHLSEHASVSAVVGTRIYPMFAPASSALPRLTYTKLDEEHQRHLGGSALITRAQYRITAWAITDILAESLSLILRNVLEFKTGTIGSGANTAVLLRCFLVRTADDFIPPTDASDRAVFGIRMDFDIWATETAPTG